MNSIQANLKNTVKQSLVNEEGLVEYKIENVVDMFSALPMYNSLTKEEIEEVKNEIKSEMSIKLDKGSLLEEKNHKKWFLSKKAELDMKYWNRYHNYLIGEKGFSTDVVNKMDDILDTLTDLLGDPSRDLTYFRRGLIIGDVQSGKTSNYIGLICKAVDSGYKVVVLLTGTIEKLRQQTQQRVDEGFVGSDSDAMVKQKDNIIVGVGKYDSSIRPVSLTSTSDDFKTKNATNLNFDLRNINGPVIFVVKKNSTILKRLNKWLSTYNQNGTNKINHSLLVVDDESDNASVNTKSNPDETPTAINGQIRKLLDMFTKSSYVGFTATPFANIFIDPESENAMYKGDLFPKDYIYSLNAPSNYIGARNIFPDYSKYHYMLVQINENKDDPNSICDLLPLKHKKDTYMPFLPTDLKQAVNAFIIANTIEDLRGMKNNHRSMLINISRFTCIQEQVASLVNDYLKRVQSACRNYGKLDSQKALKNEYLASLKATYESIYKNINVEWEIIQKQLHNSCASIIVQVFNKNAGQNFSYDTYENGLRMIAVGGSSLSRGLTLEGLVISYFYRNSKMYDTLMQMGRWFGYRKDYEDLCRIYMSEDSIQWYTDINVATDELRNDVKRYEDTGLTPQKFGLRVRSDKTTLLVTARNKMRSGETRECVISLSGEVIETPVIYSDVEKNKKNEDLIRKLVQSLVENGIEPQADGKKAMRFGFRNVPKSYIIDLIKNAEISPKNMSFYPPSVTKFIHDYKGNELDNWDIVFATGGSNETINLGFGIEYNYPTRIFDFDGEDDELFKINGTKNRIGVQNDATFGLSEKQIETVKQRKKSMPDVGDVPSQKDYFSLIDERRNPLLVIYFLQLKKRHDNDSQKIIDVVNKYKSIHVVGFGVGIPNLSDSETKYARYILNKIAAKLIQEGQEDYIEDEEDD